MPASPRASALWARGGRMAAAGAGLMMGLALLAMTQPAVGAGIFSTKEGDSDLWRAETTRLSEVSAMQRCALLLT